MSDNDYIIDATGANFERLLAQSEELPVLVDFWAEWCGPCRVLLPAVTRLAQEYQGKFILAKVNIDQEQQLATRFGVRSVPTVMLFRHGQQVDGFLGAQPESVIREMLDKHIPRASDPLLRAAATALEEGDTEQAVAHLTEAEQLDPANPDIAIGLAEAFLRQGSLDRAGEYLDRLPRSLSDDPRVTRLRALELFAGAVAESPLEDELQQRIDARPKDLEARWLLGARKMLAGQPEGALDQFLEVLRRDRTFRDDAGRRGMLAVFDLLGGSGELVARYRSRMFNALH